MLFIGVIHKCSPGEVHARAIHSSITLTVWGMYIHVFRRVGMMLEYNTGVLLARAAFIHHDDKGYSTLIHYAALIEG